MTPQEIVTEIQKLPSVQQQQILKSIAADFRENGAISEAETAERLLARGVIREIPEDWNEADEDFELIEIKGEPLSQTIIEDRR